MRNRTVVLLLALAAHPAPAQETPDTVELRELVISATRVPIERAALAASVTVLRGDELRRSGVRTAEEALRQVSGAAVVQGGSHGAFASLFMRGGESDYVQVLVDGVQVNSPGEHFDFANFTLENVERIEIVRGPVSVLYGSDAVTGVVHFITYEGGPRTRADLAVTGGRGERVGAGAEGSFGTAAIDGQLRGRAGSLAYAAGVSHFHSGGAYAFNNEHRNTGVTARLALPLAASTRAAATLRYSTNTFHYPTDGAGNLVDANVFHVADALAAGLEVARSFGPRLEARLQAGFTRNEDRYDDAPDGVADTLGFYAFYSDERFDRTAIDARLNYGLGGQHLLTLGGEYERQSERGSSLSESEFGPFPGSSAERRSNRALYAQLLGAIGSVSFQAGSRLEDNERFGTHATYRAGAAVGIAAGVRLRASAGTGFKEPRFFEQFATGFVRGNPDLEPETSRSFEAGIDVTAGALRIGATGFSQRFRNLIQYVGMPVPADAPNYRNLAAASARGIELEATLTAGRLSAGAGLTLLDTEVTDAGTGDDPLFADGERLVRRPPRTGHIALGYGAARWTAGLTASFVGSRDDLDFGGFPAARVELPAYARVDVSAEAPLRAGLRARLEVENVLAEEYQEVHNFPARGRMFLAGIRYGW